MTVISLSQQVVLCFISRNADKNRISENEKINGRPIIDRFVLLPGTAVFNSGRVNRLYVSASCYTPHP